MAELDSLHVIFLGEIMLLCPQSEVCLHHFDVCNSEISKTGSHGGRDVRNGKRFPEVIKRPPLRLL